MNDSIIPVIGDILPIIVLVWLGSWAIYRGIIAIRNREFIFYRLPFSVFTTFSDVKYFFGNQKWPTIKGWGGVLIGIIFVFIGLLPLAVSLYLLRKMLYGH